MVRAVPVTWSNLLISNTAYSFRETNFVVNSVKKQIIYLVFVDHKQTELQSNQHTEPNRRMLSSSVQSPVRRSSPPPPRSSSSSTIARSNHNNNVNSAVAAVGSVGGTTTSTTMSTAIIPQYQMSKPIWWSWYYVFDWALISTIIILTQIVFGGVGFFTPFVRHAAYEDMMDASVSYPSTPSIVPNWLLIVFTFFAPSIVFVLVQLKFRSWHDFHHGLLGQFTSIALTVLFTDCFKVYAGRLRPDFLARCMPDITGKCTNSVLNDVRDGRLSFPSGHSSLSFTVMVFVSLYLCGKLRIFRTNHGSMWKILLCVSPLFFCGFIAISRTRDYHHNYDDILAGACLGSAMAFIGYFTQYHGLSSDKCHEPKNRYYVHALELNKSEEEEDYSDDNDFSSNNVENV